MTKHTDYDTEGLRDRLVEIVVTPQMVEAGTNELREFRLGDDLGYLAEMVFRAMVYTSRGPQE